MWWADNGGFAFDLDRLGNTDRTREAGGSIKPGAQAPGIENKNNDGSPRSGRQVT
jgi:hypothetical protein